MRGMNLTRRGFGRLLGAALASVSLSACDGRASVYGAELADDVFRFGGIGPITGPAAIYGAAVKAGSIVAVDELNASGRMKMAFNWQDDEHDPEKAVNAYNTLKDWRMQVLLGTTTTTPCVAVATESNADRIFQLTPAASSLNVIGGEEIGADSPRKDNVFQMCFTDPNQGSASALYIAEKKLGTRIAVIYNNADAYSTGIYQKFVDEAAELGLNVVSVTTFTDDQTDFSVQIGDARNQQADLVFLPVYYTPASLILAEAKKQGFAPRFFGVDGMDGILTLEGFDPDLAEGVMLLTPFVATAEDEMTKRFVASYKQLTGSAENPSQFAADGYDCIMAVAQAIERAEISPDLPTDVICERLIATITDPGFVFQGLTGESTWSATGEVTKVPKGMIIQRGTYMPMDKS